MQIRDIKVFSVPVDFRTWILVKVETSEPGLSGWGEATVEWKARSVGAAVEELKELCIGEDPRRIRHLTRKMIKRHYWDPGVIGMSAISGIEMACWDILGKSLGKPVVDLLGGAVRERVPVYTHLGFGSSRDVYERSMDVGVLETLEAIIARSYHAVKIVNIPFHNQYVFAARRSAYFDLMEQVFDKCRGRIDVAVDGHGRCGSVASAEAILSFFSGKQLLFFEEIMRPATAASLASLSRKFDVRLATGERLVALRDFVDLAAQDAVAVLQPDIAHVGGILAASNIAAVAAGFNLSLAPHNPLGVVASTAGLHFALATENFLVQEEMSAHFDTAKDFIQTPIQFEAGYWTLKPCVGLGLTVDEDFVAKLAGRNEPLLTETAYDPDGAIVDW